MALGRKEDIQLSDKEKAEFDNITYEAIQSLADLNKLRKLEAYLRQEGFESTATCVRERLKALGNPILLPGDPEVRRAEEEAAKAAKEDIACFLAQVKQRDEALSAVSGGRSGTNNSAPVRTPLRSTTEVAAAPLAGAVKAKGDASVGGQVRSGQDYYSKWDRVADAALQEEDEDDCGQGEAGLEAPAIVGSVGKLSAANAGLSAAEREVLALREKEKGNDLFRAREFTSAVAAYSLSLELWPESSVVLANRAAVHMKLKQWMQAEADCDAALAVEPGYMKALLRRAAARVELGNMEGALEDAREGLKVDPSAKELLKIQEQCEKALEKKSMKRLAIEEVSDGEESEEEEEQATEEVAVGWGETSVALPTEPTGEFVACPKWGGPLPGHFSGTGDKGTGYYPDPLANPEPARASPPSTVPQPTAPVGRKRIAIEEDSDDEEGEVEVKEEVTAVEDEMEEEVAAMEAMKEEVVEEVEPEENSLQVQADSYRASGNEAFAKGEYLAAADTFSRALRLTPACPVLLNNRAACRLKMGETDLAEQDAGTAVALDPCYGKAWNRLGGCRKALGKLEGAAAAFQNALAHVPAPAKRGVEKDLAEVRKLIAARKKRRAARSPTTFGADSIEYKKGAVVIEELDSDDDDESEGEEEGEGYSKAVDDAFKVQAEVRRGKAKQAEAEWEARRRGWEERVAAVEALRQKALAARKTKASRRERSDEKKACATDEKPPSVVPPAASPVEPPTEKHAKVTDNGDVLNDKKTVPGMGLDGRKASAMENEKVEGEEEVVETGKGKKSVEELRLAGNEAFKGGEMERAGQLWAAALATDPTNVAVLSNRAMLHLKIKDFTACLADCEAVLRIEPGHVKALHRRALARRQLGELDAACADYRALLAKLPGNKQAAAEYRALLQEVRGRVTEGEGSGTREVTDESERKEEKKEVKMEEDAVNEKDTEADVSVSEDTLLSGEAHRASSASKVSGNLEKKGDGEGEVKVVTPDGPNTPPLTPPSETAATTRRKIVVEESDEEDEGEEVVVGSGNGEGLGTGGGRKRIVVEESEEEEGAEEGTEVTATTTSPAEKAIEKSAEAHVIRKKILVEEESDEEEDRKEHAEVNATTTSAVAEATGNGTGVEAVTRKKIVVEESDEEEEEGEDVAPTRFMQKDVEVGGSRRKIVIEESDEEEEKEDMAAAAPTTSLHNDVEVGGSRRKIVVEESDEEEEEVVVSKPVAVAVAEEEMPVEVVKGPSAMELKEVGNARFKAGDLTAAVEAYSAAIALEPGNAVLYGNRAMALLKDGLYGAAEADCDAALQRDPGYVKAQHRRAAARRKLGRLEEAAADYAMVRSALPKNKALEQEAEECAQALAAEKKADESKRKIPIAEESNDSEIVAEDTEAKASVGKAPVKASGEAESTAPMRDQTTVELNEDVVVETADTIREQPVPPVQKSPIDFERSVKEETVVVEGKQVRGSAKGASAEKGVMGSGGSRRRIVVEEESDDEEEKGERGDPESTTISCAKSTPEDEKGQSAAELKEVGNARFKAGELVAAVEAYSAAIALEPGNAVLYANRAMALLKDGKYGAADADCDAALQRDPQYVKARHRRAAARRKLGRLEEAAADYAAVRAALPKNKALEQEAEECTRALAAQKKAVETRRKIPVVEETDDNDEGAVVAAEAKFPAEASAISENPVGSSVAHKSTAKLHEAAAAKAAAAIRLHEAQQSLPPAPKSAVDFERTAKLFAKDPAQLATYVRQLSPEALPRLFKASLTPRIVADYATAIARGGILPRDAALGAQLLRGLTDCDRFAMNVMLMGKPGKAAVQEAVEGIEAAGVDVADLRKLYKV